MSNVADSFPKQIQVGDFVVYKLKLSEYALVFEKLQKLPALVASLDLKDDKDNSKLLAALPRLVATALPEVIEILAVATRTEPATLDETMDATTAVKCLKALFEVNDFFALWEAIQTIAPSLPAKEQPKKKT